MLRWSLGAVLMLWVWCARAEDVVVLPDPLRTVAGDSVTNVAAWERTRRPELLEAFRSQVYGRVPDAARVPVRIEVVEVVTNAMEGAATRKVVDVRFGGHGAGGPGGGGGGGEGRVRVLLFVPNGRARPVPAFLLICHRPPQNIDPTRGTRLPFWPAERLVARGYAAAAFDVADVDPDHHDGFTNGVHALFGPAGSNRPGDAWGTIAAWAWGASRALDGLVADRDIDAARVAVVGHSRGGKAALWCGAEDPRFALVISNDSGCTGAALSKRRQGETVKAINDRFPHWFCANYRQYNDREAALPVDQHELLALLAPRLAYVASAREDAWADPEGEFLACVGANPVYALYGMTGVGCTEMPPVDVPQHGGRVGYHIRRGKHDLTEYDWDCYMRFADRHWGR